MYRLTIANKNYSSWSLRPWLLMRELAIPFDERLVPFSTGPGNDSFLAFAPNGKVPCLHDGEQAIWDSLAIIEHLAERHPAVWPADPVARSWARCVSAEMHSGFGVLREQCTMNCGIRVRLATIEAALLGDISRIVAIWNEGIARFGGPFLCGAQFHAVDAMFAPVALRFQTYGIALPGPAADYCSMLLARPAVREWYDAALQETWREPGHEDEAHRAGAWLEDLRRR